jgi:hypothetical protein
MPGYHQKKCTTPNTPDSTKDARVNVSNESTMSAGLGGNGFLHFCLPAGVYVLDTLMGDSDPLLLA